MFTKNWTTWKIPRLFGLVMFIFLSFNQPSYALDRVPWSQLSYYLTENGVTLKKLPLRDCPLGLNEAAPSHNVIQVIANTLYEWQEYEFDLGGGQDQLAISMLRPEKKRLNVAEAQVLLTASASLQGLQEQTRLRAERQLNFIAPPDNRSPGRMPGPGKLTTQNTLRSSTQGTDDRTRVGEHTQQYPYNTIANLDFVSEGESYTGTGFLISATCVLTAGHNLYWPPATDYPWSSQMSITPAQQQPYTGANLIRPYGSISSNDLRTNQNYVKEYNVINEPSEYDYGAIILGSTFSGINTFMALEFDGLPPTVNATGYPGHVRDEQTHDMWQSSGIVYRTRGAQKQIIDFAAFVSSGNSGGPIWYYNRFSDTNRVVGIVTWQDALFDSGVRLTSLNHDLILKWLNESSVSTYNHHYYIPLFLTGNNNWTGLGLTNHNNAVNDIKVEYYTSDGGPAGSEFAQLQANGQIAFACNPTTSESGWIKVSATLPLYGLALIGDTTPSTLFDIDFQGTLHQHLILPHLAADGEEWNSTAILCNPNPSVATVTYTFYEPEKGTPSRAQTTIPAWGSINDDLKTRFGKILTGGHIMIDSTQPLAGFLLYDSSFSGKNNWKAGLSAMPLQ